MFGAGSPPTDHVVAIFPDMKHACDGRVEGAVDQAFGVAA
jgi:hypothetical protein